MEIITSAKRNSAEWLYSLCRDRDSPRRAYSGRREAKTCRACGSKYISNNSLSRQCPACAKEKQARDAREGRQIQDRKGA